MKRNEMKKLLDITYSACWYGIVVGGSLLAVIFFFFSTTRGDLVFLKPQHSCPCGGFAGKAVWMTTHCETCGSTLWPKLDRSYFKELKEGPR